MARYLSQSTFDPVQEILKEKNIQNFFKQKYNILMMYLEESEDKDNDGNNKKRFRYMVLRLVYSFLTSWAH